MDFLGFKQYRVEGISGGGPYALALTHISTRSEVLATLLLAPGTPIEASRAGQSMQAYLRELFNYFPLVAEMRLDIKRRMFTESTAALQHTPTHKLRETAPGRKFIETCAEYATAAGYVHDYAAGDRHWGFELEDVDANRIVIFAGGLDESTPVDGMRYMRNRLRNAELVEYPNETHSSLQENHGYRARELLLKM
jgi:pimeloyl-ACP methyl ester carboxylesterase